VLFFLKSPDGLNAFKRVSIHIFHLTLVVNYLLTKTGCPAVRRNGAFCCRFETHTHRNQDVLTHTFYGCEDFHDHNQQFLENILNHLDLLND
jgi:hypothetical protein